VDRRPIGVFDSGVGGLTVFRALAAALPDESFVYLGDTARVPYGTKSPETVRRYAREASHFFRRQDVKLMVVACNTVSAVAMDAVAWEAGMPALGVILPGARLAAEASRRKRIGVIGTRATVGSGAYTRAIREVVPRAEVLAQACPLFVPLAEEGWTDNEVARATAESYLAPLREAGVDALVLGCTHYPLLKDTIAGVMGPGVALVDSAEAIAGAVRQRLDRERTLVAGRREDGARPEHRFFVTDGPEPFTAIAARFLGREPELLERVRIEPEGGEGEGEHAP